MKKFLFGFAALALLASSCKKDDDNSGSGKRNTLTNGMWRISASSSTLEYPAPIGTRTVDAFALFPACQQDNLYIFNSDGTSTTDEGPTKCNSSSPQQSASGTWSLNGDETQLTVAATSSTQGLPQSIVADILTLNSSTLEIRYVTNVNNIRATTTTTYTHQ